MGMSDEQIEDPKRVKCRKCEGHGFRPSAYAARELLSGCGVVATARAMGVGSSTVSDILRGRRPVSWAFWWAARDAVLRKSPVSITQRLYDLGVEKTSKPLETQKANEPSLPPPHFRF